MLTKVESVLVYEDPLGFFAEINAPNAQQQVDRDWIHVIRVVVL